jgi:hypothetical protein
MKIHNINKISLILIFFVVSIATICFFEGCKPSQQIAIKTGAQLWAENCQRCHNTPSPSTFSAEQWETIGMHMQTRALITEDEKNKIVSFLKQ